MSSFVWFRYSLAYSFSSFIYFSLINFFLSLSLKEIYTGVVHADGESCMFIMDTRIRPKDSQGFVANHLLLSQEDVYIYIKQMSMLCPSSSFLFTLFVCSINYLSLLLCSFFLAFSTFIKLVEKYYCFINFLRWPGAAYKEAS